MGYFKFFNGHKKHSLYDELIKNYGLSPGIAKWIDRVSIEINYSEDPEYVGGILTVNSNLILLTKKDLCLKNSLKKLKNIPSMKKNGIVNINSDELNNIDNIKPLIDRYSSTNFIHPTDPEITEIKQQKNPIDDYIFNDNFDDMMKNLLNDYNNIKNKN